MGAGWRDNVAGKIGVKPGRLGGADWRGLLASKLQVVAHVAPSQAWTGR